MLSEYRKVVGFLRYLILTKFDIVFGVNKLYQFMAPTTEVHWLGVKKLLRYPKNNLNYALTFFKFVSIDLVGLCDADYASSPNDRRSTGAYCICLGESLISWQSSQQKVVFRNNIEIEYHAMA